MSIPAFPAYRDSGVGWIGTVPNAWDVKPLKHLAHFINGEAFKPTEWSDDGTPIIRIQNLNGGDDFNCFNGEVNPRHHVQKGDLLFGWSGNRGTSFGPFVWPREGLHYLNQHIFKVEPRGCDAGWFYWCLKAVTLYVEEQAHGIIGMVHVTKGDLGAIPVPLPEHREQLAIAEFLDRETGKIDALVAEQERLIGLLREKREAVISHAVTKGLDPHATMKDSGVEWLGQVPAHWDVTRLGRITATRCDGPFGSGLKSEHYTDEGVRVIRLQNIRMGHFDDADAAFIDEEYFRNSLTGHAVQAGDVLIAGLGDDRNIVGRCCIAPQGVEPAMVKADCFRFRLFTQRALPKFVALQLTAGSQFDAGMMSSGSTRSRISMSMMATRPVALPPLPEQQELAEEIEARARDFDTLTAEAHSAIALLRERRAALISAAVTGKIDVRGLATPTEAKAA